MPNIVACWRTYKDEKGETVIEKHMMYAVDAAEAVRNGKGEWSRKEPAKPEAPIVDAVGPLTPIDSETRPEKRARKKRHFETDGEE